MSSAVIFQIQSLLILILMIYGVMQARKNRKLHVKIMCSAMLWDLLLILQIELARSAVAKAMKIVENPMMLKIHLFFAIGSVILYGFMLYSGARVLKNNNGILPRHRIAGKLTLVFRTLTLITSYFAV